MQQRKGLRRDGSARIYTLIIQLSSRAEGHGSVEIYGDPVLACVSSDLGRAYGRQPIREMEEKAKECGGRFERMVGVEASMED